MTVLDVAPHALARIAGIVDGALADSGALGELPTPLDALRRHARLEVVERGGLPEQILGALWFEERLMYVNSGQSKPRRAFTEAHELVHALCPWHRAVLRLDTETELFRAATDAIEAEANAGAAMVLFQGSGFASLAAAEPPSLTWVKALAEMHATSLHATMHSFAQTHADPVAMLTVGRFPQSDGSLPVWRRVHSRSFAASSGPAAADLGTDRIMAGSPLRELLESARTGSDGAEGSIGRLRVEAHYNRHTFLVLISPPAAPCRGGGRSPRRSRAGGRPRAGGSASRPAR